MTYFPMFDVVQTIGSTRSTFEALLNHGDQSALQDGRLLSTVGFRISGFFWEKLVQRPWEFQGLNQENVEDALLILQCKFGTRTDWPKSGGSTESASGSRDY